MTVASVDLPTPTGVKSKRDDVTNNISQIKPDNYFEQNLIEDKN